VATDGSARHLKQVLDRLEREGVGVATLAVQRPTLDDVFLSLTGTPASRELEGASR
jgi:hypothetical protein